MASFQNASTALSIAADVDISGRHIQRLVGEVGADLKAQCDHQAQQYRHRQLPSQVDQPPAVAVVELDGGRLNTREPDSKPGVHNKQGKEDKIACLLTPDTQPHDDDPQPEPPQSFLDSTRVARLVKRMKATASASQRTDDEDSEDAPQSEPLTDRESKPSSRKKPPPLKRTCVATMANSKAFGPMVAGEAQRRGFFDAKRQAFVADGLNYNWTIHKTWFPHFVPITDFLHVLCYLYTAAQAVGESEMQSWSQFEVWMRACWQGRVADVVTQLERWQAQVGVPAVPESDRHRSSVIEAQHLSRPPPEDESESETQAQAQVVQEALTYLRNNTKRMNYPQYRRSGLPVTSSLVESLVCEFNDRVKSALKYWERGPGSEAILQVRAAVLSEDDRLKRYFAERPGNPYRRRPKRT